MESVMVYRNASNGNSQECCVTCSTMSKYAYIKTIAQHVNRTSNKEGDQNQKRRQGDRLP